MLAGFFRGWKAAPSIEGHLQILRTSPYVVLALDESTGNVVGFIYAITDGLLNAYVPMLEVLSQFRRQGIGKDLVRRMLQELDKYYMVALLCDPELQPFYDSCGMIQATGRKRRNFTSKES